MFRFILFFLVLVFTTNILKSTIPCDTLSPHSGYKISLLSNYPPLTTDMSYDVMIGYIACDSLRRNAKLYQVEDFFQRQTYNDTLRYVMRFLYKMMDYDPIKFFKYIKHVVVLGDLQMEFVFDAATSAMYKNNKDFVLTHILNSYYILHVKVIDTIRLPTPEGFICNYSTEASLQVLDTIKGKVLPMHYSQLYPGNTYIPKIAEKVDRNKINSFYPTNNLVITYCNQWPLGGESTGKFLADSNDVTYLKPQKEYIVFLVPRLICTMQPIRDSFFSITPLSFSSSCDGMYPIENGFVLDSGNDFGLGQQVPISVFKNHLQDIINSIITYGE